MPLDSANCLCKPLENMLLLHRHSGMLSALVIVDDSETRIATLRILVWKDCMMAERANFFETNVGLWTFLQLTGILLAACVFLVQQNNERKKIENERLDRLINSRNALQYLVRYIPIALGRKESLIGKDNDRIVMFNCLDRVKGIDIYNIYPAEFSEGVVAIQVAGALATDAMDKEMSGAKKDEIIETSARHLRWITEYIKSHVNVIEVENGVVRRR